MRRTVLAAALFSSLILLPGCTVYDALFSPPGVESDIKGVDYRDEMRNFVKDLSRYAKTTAPAFAVIPQNGEDLGVDKGTGAAVPDYLAAIDGQGRENLLYGYDADDVATPADVTEAMRRLLDIEKANGVRILVTDYCSSPAHMDLSYQQNGANGYLSFAADHRELDDIPVYPAKPWRSGTGDISSLSQANNFLYILNLGGYSTREQFLAAIAATDYDVVIMDAFFDGTEIFLPSEVAGLKRKASGGRRLVIAYMSIGEAEDYRYYWGSSWKLFKPAWLEGENPDWEGNYKVRYWAREWQEIIYGSDGSYLKKIISAGFDGVYLDIIDAYEYFEEIYGG